MNSSYFENDPGYTGDNYLPDLPNLHFLCNRDEYSINSQDIMHGFSEDFKRLSIPYPSLYLGCYVIMLQYYV